LIISAKERNDRVSRLLEKVGKTDQKKKYPNQIFRWQKQRVAVARALVTNPQIVLADEPTANLDHKTAFKIIDIMHEMTMNLEPPLFFHSRSKNSRRSRSDTYLRRRML